MNKCRGLWNDESSLVRGEMFIASGFSTKIWRSQDGHAIHGRPDCALSKGNLLSINIWLLAEPLQTH